MKLGLSSIPVGDQSAALAYHVLDLMHAFHGVLARLTA